jgi:hypothetical protein
MTMTPERRRDSLAGQYRLNLTATGCSVLPSELRRRSYDATIEQEGARLTVTVRGASLIAGDSIRFTGVYHGDGQIIFGIGTFLNYYYYYYGPLAQEIAERLSTTSTLVINGTVVTRHDGNGVIAGTLNGVFATSARTGPPFHPYSAACGSTSHAFELRRQ